MEVILGAGGATSNELTKVLAEQNRPVRLVSRNPRASRPNEETYAADLLDPEAARAAVRGGKIAYLLVGLPYRTALWEKLWPKLINNVLNACAAENCALVFLDNIYLYDPAGLGTMTEESPIAPNTQKGKVRAAVARAVHEAHTQGRVRTLIARSADFYGLGTDKSVLHELLIDPILKGKRPQWLVDATMPHNHTYLPDIGRALAQLGVDEGAYGRTWHLPTSGEAPTGEQWARLASEAADKDYRPPRVLPAWSVKLAGIFQRDLAALHEMLYMYRRPYRFTSAVFTERYGWEATPVREAVEGIVGTRR